MEWILKVKESNGLGSQDQQCFIISEVAADWHELMIGYRGVLCGHTFPAIYWTCGAAWNENIHNNGF